MRRPNLGHLFSLAASVLVGSASLGCFSSALARVLEDARGRSELRIDWVEAAAPFSAAGPDGRPQGYAIELCQDVAAAVAPGLRLALRPVALQQGLDDIGAMQADLLCGAVTSTIDRLRRMDLTSLFGGSGVIVGAGAPSVVFELLAPTAEPPRSLRNRLLERVKPRRVAVIAGSTGAACLDRRLHGTEAAVAAVAVSTHDEAARLLASGEGDACRGRRCGPEARRCHIAAAAGRGRAAGAGASSGPRVPARRGSGAKPDRARPRLRGDAWPVVRP